MPHFKSIKLNVIASSGRFQKENNVHCSYFVTRLPVYNLHLQWPRARGAWLNVHHKYGFTLGGLVHVVSSALYAFFVACATHLILTVHVLVSSVMSWQVVLSPKHVLFEW